MPIDGSETEWDLHHVYMPPRAPSRSLSFRVFPSGPWHSARLLPLPLGSTPALFITRPRGWLPPGLHSFLLFLLIKETSHSLLHQPFKFPIFWTFQIRLEESQRQSLFSFCSYYALQGPFIGMETTAFSYTLCVHHPTIWLCNAHSALHITQALEYLPSGTLSCPVSSSVNLSISFLKSANLHASLQDPHTRLLSSLLCLPVPWKYPSSFTYLRFSVCLSI